MAMLAGLKGVRSAVISQIATYIEAPAITQIKSGLYVPTVLEKLGIDSLTAYVDTEANWFNKLYDKALGLLPADDEEECQSSCCHRVRFMYGLLYEHDQLNRATHNALHEMFGEANVESLQHLAILVRKGHLVDADGREIYMDNLDRLAIPIRFIHGLENACFRPISTQRTCDELKGRNGRSLYDRIEIPNYGHIDCIFGRNAVIDVYPKILEHLEKTA
jgi:cholesterol oxidase